MKEKLKSISLFKIAVVSFRAIRNRYRLSTRISNLFGYFKDYSAFRKLPTNGTMPCRTRDLYPRIYDKTKSTDVDPVYYLQGTWCAKKIFENKPARHYDIGSQALMVGIISQFTPTIMVDIRPLSVSLPGLDFTKGSITALPFRDSSIASLSSICVIEHIGLGRYGDPLDQFGTEKAVKELVRVIAPGGNLYISVPIDSENKVNFNAHRTFTREYVLQLFSKLTLKEEKYIYGKNLEKSYDRSRGFGTGLYHFCK